MSNSGLPPTHPEPRWYYWLLPVVWVYCLGVIGAFAIKGRAGVIDWIALLVGVPLASNRWHTLHRDREEWTRWRKRTGAERDSDGPDLPTPPGGAA